jgi:predicted membrane protein
MTLTSTMSARPEAFNRAWRSLASRRFLPGLLLLLGTASNGLYAHAPLVALAAMAGVMLPRRRAIAVALLLWAINQGIGFGLRGYPLTGTALAWGLLMGVGTLVVATFASWRPAFSQTGWWGHGLWLAIAVIGGFLIYQGSIMLAYPALAAGHTMGWEVMASLFRKQMIWAIAIALLHGLLLRRQMTLLHPAQT